MNAIAVIASFRVVLSEKEINISLLFRSINIAIDEH